MKKRVDLPEKNMKDIFLIWTAPWWTVCRSITGHGVKPWLERGLRTMCSGRMNFIPAAENPPMMWCVFLNERYGMHMDAESTAADKRRIYLEMLEKEGMQPIQEVVEFVHSLGDAPKAIATGSAMPGASRTLAAAGLSGLFDVILTPDEVEHGKPAPDMFLKAAELLGASPDRCVVFEDAEPGMKAAAAAGMDCIQVRRPSLA